eukprot:CAMPEP_0117518724 /NCGR_PEP_ID=MMETSP0784-20121206/32281_1 /TAXON_ID=39447 /ORGANISM="" /LENGTH=36 /DNA_ID= /DNA_START= /DNA_END= /DNA_ORIENTATION=
MSVGAEACFRRETSPLAPNADLADDRCDCDKAGEEG